MDATMLRAECENLAALLSEVTPGDLSATDPVSHQTVNDVLVEAIKDCLAVGGNNGPSTGRPEVERVVAKFAVNQHGGGYEQLYREFANPMCVALIADEQAGPQLARAAESVRTQGYAVARALGLTQP